MAIVESFEEYTSGTGVNNTGQADTWNAQTFSHESTFTLAKIELWLGKENAEDVIGDVIIAITETSAGKPTGADIVSETINGNLLPAIGGGTRVEIVFEPGCILTQDKQYAITIKCPGADVDNLLYIYGSSIGGYANGTRVYTSTDPVSWNIGPGGWDIAFRVHSVDALITANKSRFNMGMNFRY